MKKLNTLANELIYGDMVEKVATIRGISLSEAREIISQMSFIDYRTVSEATITPPSGQTIGPTSQPQQQPQSSQSSNIKAIWPGKGAPVEVGMTVGLKGANGLPIPGQVSQVDMGAKGVKVKNPTTGQDEWMNLDMLQPFAASTNSPGTGNTGTTGTTGTGGTTGPAVQPGVAEDAELSRILELAGVRENCSGGATGAGAIAIAPAAMGTMKKRQYPEESLKAEYTPKVAAKTIIGDTKPNQASGKLSADLAASGKKAAGRINNGRKRP